MQAHTARVVALDSAKLTLDVEASFACARCAAGKGCGAGLIGSSEHKSRQLVLPLPATLRLERGDRVRLTLPGGRLLQAALLVYGLPLFGLLLALILGGMLSSGLSEGAAVALAAAGLAVGALTGQRMIRRESCFLRLMPEIAERLPAGNADNPGGATGSV